MFISTELEENASKDSRCRLITLLYRPTISLSRTDNPNVCFRLVTRWVCSIIQDARCGSTQPKYAEITPLRSTHPSLKQVDRVENKFFFLT